MKLLFVLFPLMIVTAKACSKSRGSGEIPTCIQQKINSIKAQPKWNPPAEVWEYTYAGKTVYLFSSDCCDQYNTVYDANCNYVCAPSGGLTGKGDGKCEDFNANARQVKLVWKDSR